MPGGADGAACHIEGGNAPRSYGRPSGAWPRTLNRLHSWAYSSMTDPAAALTQLDYGMAKSESASWWNGNEGNHLGNPQSRGLATWVCSILEYTMPSSRCYSSRRKCAQDGSLRRR